MHKSLDKFVILPALTIELAALEGLKNVSTFSQLLLIRSFLNLQILVNRK